MIMILYTHLKVLFFLIIFAFVFVAFLITYVIFLENVKAKKKIMKKICLILCFYFSVNCFYLIENKVNSEIINSQGVLVIAFYKY